MSVTEGVVKYTAHHGKGSIEDGLRALSSTDRAAAVEALRRFPALDAGRTALHDAGLIGTTAEGIGYGNISLRLAGDMFLISGSGTGAARVLGKEGYSLVYDFDREGNTVRSCGPVPASSESMTHGALYRAAPTVRCVAHVHAPALFEHLLARGCPHTPPEAAYGTPALSRAAADVMRRLPPEEGFFVTAGHPDGIFAYGMDIDAAIRMLLTLKEQETT